MNTTELLLPQQYLRQIADQITCMGAQLPFWLQQAMQPGPGGELEVPDLSFNDFKRLIAEAIDLTGDPAFGLLVGDRLLINSHGLLGYVSTHGTTPREILTLITHYFPLRTSLAAVHVDLSATHARLCLTQRQPLEPVAQPVMEAIALTLKNLYEYVTMDNCRIHRAHLAFPKPSYLSLAETLFNCEVCYGAAWTGFEMPVDTLDRPVRNSNPAALQQAIERCQAELVLLKRKQGLAARIRELMLTQQSRLPSLQVTARLLNLTPRTLHRRLQEENTSYREILDDVRRQLTLHQLQDERLSLQEIAYRLGYSDLANFRRAFRRWTRTTPSCYRQTLLSAPVR